MWLDEVSVNYLQMILSYRDAFSSHFELHIKVIIVVGRDLDNGVEKGVSHHRTEQ